MSCFSTLSLVLLLVFAALPMGAQQISWTQAGGPEGGHIVALLTTPSGAIVAGTMRGVYRSTTRGASWERSPFIDAAVNTLARTETGSVFAGTDKGIYLSQNSGESWELAGFGSTEARVFAPGSGRLLLVYAGGQLYRSLDAGANWTILDIRDFPGRPFTAMAIDRRGRLFAAGGYQIARSSDSGATWENILLMAVIPEGGTPALTSIIVDSAGTIFAGTQGPGGAIHWSTDGGASWDAQGNGGVSSFIITSYGALLAGSPIDGVLSSTNGGAVWQRIGPDSIDVSALTEGPEGDLYAGSYTRGIFVSSDRGASWRRSNSGLVATVVHSLLARRRADGAERILAGTDGGLFGSVGAGQSWSPIAFDGFPVTILARGEGEKIYAAGMYQNSIVVSHDGARTWERIGIRLPGITSTTGIRAIAPGADSLLLVALRGPDYGGSIGEIPGALYRTTDDGDIWQPVLENKDIHTVVYGSSEIFAGGDRVYVSDDRGVTWTTRDLGISPLVQIMEMLAHSDGRIIAAASDGTIYTLGSGATLWHPVTTTPPALGVVTAIVETTGGIFFATAREGVFFTDHAMTAWAAVNQGLSNRSVLSLVLDADGSFLAGTEGSGVFRSSTAVSVPATPPRAGTSSIEAYPNPAGSSTSITLTLESSAHARIALVDALGRTVTLLADRRMNAGAHTLPLDLSALPAGLYHLRLETGGEVQGRLKVEVRR